MTYFVNVKLILTLSTCHRLKSNYWPKKVIVKLARGKDASKILRGKKKLKTTDLSQKGFPPNTIVFIKESLCSCYRFLWSECKKLWFKKSIVSFWVSNGSIKESKKVTPPPPPYDIGFTYQRLGEAFQHRCAVSWWERQRVLTFQVDLLCFCYCFKVLLYILHLFVLISNTCFSFLSTWIVTDKTNALFSINSTMATVTHRSFFIAVDPIIFHVR